MEELPFLEVAAHIAKLWRTDGAFTYRVPYEDFEDRSLFRSLLYRFQEFTGAGTF